MASKTQRAATTETEEYCDACEEAQPVAVSITIHTESPARENAAFSREPYRITECLGCGATTKTRMNDV